MRILTTSVAVLHQLAEDPAAPEWLLVMLWRTNPWLRYRLATNPSLPVNYIMLALADLSATTGWLNRALPKHLQESILLQDYARIGVRMTTQLDAQEPWAHVVSMLRHLAQSPARALGRGYRAVRDQPELPPSVELHGAIWSNMLRWVCPEV